MRDLRFSWRYQDHDVLCSDAVQYGGWVPAFRSNLLPSTSRSTLASPRNVIASPIHTASHPGRPLNICKTVLSFWKSGWKWHWLGQYNSPKRVAVTVKLPTALPPTATHFPSRTAHLLWKPTLQGLLERPDPCFRLQDCGTRNYKETPVTIPHK
jgi:hypothetical protein